MSCQVVSSATDICLDYTACQSLDERHVAIQEIVGRQSIERLPADLLKDAVHGLAFKLGDAVKDQLNRGPARIRVLVAGDFLSDRSADIKLLRQFARERRAQLLTRFRFSARELPFPGVMATSFPLADQNPPTSLD